MYTFFSVSVSVSQADRCIAVRQSPNAHHHHFLPLLLGSSKHNAGRGGGGGEDKCHRGDNTGIGIASLGASLVWFLFFFLLFFSFLFNIKSDLVGNVRDINSAALATLRARGRFPFCSGPENWFIDFVH